MGQLVAVTRWCGLFLLLASILSGCPGGGSSSSDGVTPDTQTSDSNISPDGAALDGSDAVPATGMIGAFGGTVSVADGSKIEIPVGALAQPVTLTIVPSATPPGITALSTFYEFGPAGTQFKKGATVTFSYDPNKLPQGGDPNRIQILWTNADNTLLPLPSKVDTTNHTVSATVYHFSGGGVTYAPLVCCKSASGRKSVTLPADCTGKTLDSSYCADLDAVCCDVFTHYQVMAKIACDTFGNRADFAWRCSTQGENICCRFKSGWHTTTHIDSCQEGGGALTSYANCAQICCQTGAATYEAMTRGNCAEQSGKEADAASCGGQLSNNVCCATNNRHSVMSATDCSFFGGSPSLFSDCDDEEKQICCEKGGHFVMGASDSCDAGQIRQYWACDTLCCQKPGGTPAPTSRRECELGNYLVVDASQCGDAVDLVCCKSTSGAVATRARVHCAAEGGTIVDDTQCKQLNEDVCCDLGGGKFKLSSVKECHLVGVKTTMEFCADEDGAVCCDVQGIVARMSTKQCETLGKLAEKSLCDVICCEQAGEFRQSTKGFCANSGGSVVDTEKCFGIEHVCCDVNGQAKIMPKFECEILGKKTEMALCADNDGKVCCTLYLDYATITVEDCAQHKGHVSPTDTCKAVCCDDGNLTEMTTSGRCRDLHNTAVDSTQCVITEPVMVCCDDAFGRVHVIDQESCAEFLGWQGAKAVEMSQCTETVCCKKGDAFNKQPRAECQNNLGFEVDISNCPEPTDPCAAKTTNQEKFCCYVLQQCGGDTMESCMKSMTDDKLTPQTTDVDCVKNAKDKDTSCACWGPLFP